jgi:hypothetical protein
MQIVGSMWLSGNRLVWINDLDDGRLHLHVASITRR